MKKSTIFNVDQFEITSEFAESFTVEESKHSKNYATFTCKKATIDVASNLEILPVFYKLNRFSKSFTIPEKHRLYKELSERLEVELPDISNFIDIYAESDGKQYKAVVIKFW